MFVSKFIFLLYPCLRWMQNLQALRMCDMLLSRTDFIQFIGVAFSDSWINTGNESLVFHYLFQLTSCDSARFLFYFILFYFILFYVMS